MQTRFILINTSHAGNVGAAARAMKTMGFGDLVLVAPRWANVLHREETIGRASGALDVLKNARIVATLDEALDGMTHLCATAMTPRDFGPPTVTPREHFGAFVKAEPALTAGGIAFLFGCERFGMSNEDVYRCHVALSIPSDPKFGSLNLGAALQVIAYEWRLALGAYATAVRPELFPQTVRPELFPQTVRPELFPQTVRPEPVEGQSTSTLRQAQDRPSSVRTEALADAQQVAGMLAHLEQALQAVGFLDPQAPKKLMPRLNQLFNRAGVTPEEVHIFRGIAKAMLQSATRQHGLPRPAASQ